MKYVFVYLALLIMLFSLFPYILTSCNKYNDDSNENFISVYDNKTDQVSSVKLEDYIVGVVSAEMPASFSKEALKAQAVAARTYAMRKINKNLPEHKGADVCTDFAHCQAYISQDSAKENWKKDFEKNFDKVKAAVYSTAGECLEYNNEFAITVFHSCSNGITEKASDVWGGEIPYLVNTDSPGDLFKKDYVTDVDLSSDEFIKKLENHIQKEIDKTESVIGDITYTKGNNVDLICLYGNSIKGTDIRKIYSLKSTAFTLEHKDGRMIFSVSGNGHGVGMSQYGAEYMAKNKKTYVDILNHYYPGTNLTKLNNKDKN